MKAKKIAVRGLIILACVVAVCMFFSGTVRTIATAKVKIVVPRQGKLSQTVSLTGRLRFTGSEDVTLPDMGGYTLDVKSVSVQVGSEVKAGDVVFTAQITDYDKTLAGLRSEYDAAEAQLRSLSQKNVTLRRTEEAWAEAYVEITDAAQARADALLAWQAQMRLEGLTEMPPEPGEELEKAWQAHQAAEAAYEAASEKMSQAERFTVSDEVRAYVADRKKYEDQLAQAEENIVELMVLSRQTAQVTAPQDGYITKVNVKAGETFNPASAAYAVCGRDELPVIRADVGDSSLTMSKGMSATLTSRYGYDLNTETCAVGVTLEGEKYVEIALTREIIEEMGGVSAMGDKDIGVKVEYKAPEATTLLPAAAVRGSGKERYVYVLRNGTTAFGENQMTVSKMDVTVLAEAGDLISIEENLSWEQVAYMEDRAISDNSVVMEYSD